MTSLPPEAIIASPVDEDEYVWCLHCERAYKEGECREVVDNDPTMGPPVTLEMCPYPDCDGDAVLDQWSWAEIATPNGYPDTPELGKVYPMYPENS